MNYKKIIIVSPPNLITGGPEALHHLVHEMRMLGLPAHITYYPYSQKWTVPSEYCAYDVNPNIYEDVVGNLIIFPETFTEQLGWVRYADTAIWWLSLDNFLVKNQRPHDTFLREKIRYLRLALKGARPIFGVSGLKKSLHFSQSRYAQNYLFRQGISSQLLIEPINESFLTQVENKSLTNRRDIILYNPAKGYKYTQQLIEAFPEYQFLPLKGYSRSELLEIMRSSKIYVDFGHHPGRDRMPREAAMLGMIVITSTYGSAGIDEDVPLPHLFKIDTSQINFVEEAGNLIKHAIDNFQHMHNLMRPYRDYLITEPELFKQCIRRIFLG